MNMEMQIDLMNCGVFYADTDAGLLSSEMKQDSKSLKLEEKILFYSVIYYDNYILYSIF